MSRDLGRRLREARLRAGLTQQQVADGVVSAAFLSMVESGRREPSPEVLARIAQRLDLDPADHADAGGTFALVAIRIGLQRAEHAVAAADFAGALRELETIDRVFTAVQAPDLRIEFHYWRGRAMEGLARIDSAIRELVCAVELAAARGSAFREIEMSIDLARCLRLRGDLSAALDRVNSLHERLPAEMEGSPLHAALLTTVIAVHFARGDQSMAHLAADRAREVFEGQEDSHAKALLLWNASLAAEANADVEGALLLATEAARLSSRSDDGALLGRLQVAIGWLCTRVAPPDLEGAAERFAMAGEIFGSGISALDSASLLSETARLCWLRSDYEGARRDALAALALFGDGPNALAASPRLLAARAEASLGDLTASRRHFAAAQRILDGSERSRMTSLAWRELGDVYLDLDFREDAVLAYQQALMHAGLTAVPVSSLTSATEPSTVQ